MKTIPASSMGNIRIATGTIAMAGIGLPSSVSGPKTLENAVSGRAGCRSTTPATAAMANPVRMRISDGRGPASSPGCRRWPTPVTLPSPSAACRAQPEPNVVGGQQLPEPDRRRHRPDPHQPGGPGPSSGRGCRCRRTATAVASASAPSAVPSHRTRQRLLVVDDRRARVGDGVALRAGERAERQVVSPVLTQMDLSANQRVPNSVSGT